MILCVDFDGVIHDPTNRDPGYRMGKPMPGALEAIEHLVNQGHTLIIHTARCTRIEYIQHVVDWLAYFGFPPLPVDITKPMADVYLDDKGMHFSDWTNAFKQLGLGLLHGQARTSEQAEFPAVESARRAREHYTDQGQDFRPGNH